MPINNTIIDIIQDRAKNTPGQRAYTFITGNSAELNNLNYQQLELKSLNIATAIQQTCLFTEHQDASINHQPRILLLFPPSLDFITAFYGCLLSGAVAVPAAPLDFMRLERTLPRLMAILENSGACTILTTDKIYSEINSFFENVDKELVVKSAAINKFKISIAKFNWLITDKEMVEHSTQWQPVSIEPHDLAFLQYTSGSTSKPKGVMISHENMMHNLEVIHKVAQQNQDSCFVSWLPMYHDMGLIGSVLYPIYIGFHSVQMSAISFLKRPIRWFQAINKYKATITAAPNFAYELCINKINIDNSSAIELNSLDLVLTGAEPIRSQVIKTFADKFSDIGLNPQAILPSYGLAESTCAVSGNIKLTTNTFKRLNKQSFEQGVIIEHNAQTNTLPQDDISSIELISSGAPLPSVELKIVNPVTLQPSPINHIGEVWLASRSIAQGYWQQPNESENTFNQTLSIDDKSVYLRTGDLGFMLDGQLFITGRLKDLIILNGLNYYPQDIEISVEQSHPEVRSGCTIAVSVDTQDHTALYIVAEVRAKAHELSDEIKEAIRRKVNVDHNISIADIFLIQPGSINKTSSGKLQRNACKQDITCNRLKCI